MASLSRSFGTIRTAFNGICRRNIGTTAAVSGGDGLYVHRDTPENNSDIKFEFNAENKARAEAIMSIYPEGKPFFGSVFLYSNVLF